MKSLLAKFFVLCLPFPLFAQPLTCDVDVNHETHIKNNSVSVYQNGQPKVVINENNQLFIDGKAISLDAMQQQAIEVYREKMSTYVPKAKDIAAQGVNWLDGLLDDVGGTLKNQSAFDNVKKFVDDTYTTIESRYYKTDGTFILPKNAIKDALGDWQADLPKMMENFNGEFFSSAFNVLSEKMKKEGFSLPELQAQFTDLKAKLTEQMKTQSSEFTQKANDYCQSLKDIAVEEQALHEKIPQLKNYKVFNI